MNIMEIKDNNNGRNIIRKRRFIDWQFLVLQIISIIIMVPLIWYCMKYGAFERLTRGYDSCRNICGQENVMVDEMKKSLCDGLDMRYRPYLLVFRPDGRNHYNATRLHQHHNDAVVPIMLQDNVQRVCLVNCSVYQHYVQYKNRCILQRDETVSDVFWGKSGLPNFLLEVAEDIAEYWPELLYLTLLSVVLSAILTTLFLFLFVFTVWLILIGLILISLLCTAYSWTMWRQWKYIINDSQYLPSELDLRRTTGYLVSATLGMLFVVCAYTMLYKIKNRLTNITKLLQKAWEPIVVMPLLLVQSLVTTIFVGILHSVSLYFFLWVESSGHDVELYDDFYEYQKDYWIYFANLYNVLNFLWCIKFVIDCQCVVTAEAVSVWYFAVNKNNLGTPIFYGLYNLVCYHVGSVSLGSLYSLTLGACKYLIVLREWCTQKNRESKSKVIGKLSLFAYIEIILYNESFYRSGKNIYRSLNNAFLDDEAYFVIFLGKVFISVTVASVGFIIFQEKEDVQYPWILIILVGYFAYITAHCFLMVYEVVIDVELICFFEDCTHNSNGKCNFKSPSRGLLELITSAPKLNN